MTFLFVMVYSLPSGNDIKDLHYLSTMKVMLAIAHERRAVEVSVKENSRVFDVLNAAGINPETVVIFKNKKPIPLDEHVKDGDELYVIGVISGG